MHRRSILIIVQRDATQSNLFIILQVHCTCFGCQLHPSSGVHKTVTTASGTGHIFLCSYLPPTWPSSLGYFRERGQPRSATLEGPVPEAVVTVLCAPDGVCGWHPKHVVQWTFRIINRLLCVASRWTIININLPMFWRNLVFHILEGGLRGSFQTFVNIYLIIRLYDTPFFFTVNKTTETKVEVLLLCSALLIDGLFIAAVVVASRMFCTVCGSHLATMEH